MTTKNVSHSFELNALHVDVTDERVPWLRGSPSIVFHHGVGASADAWSGWTPALVERHRLVRFDMRGHGRSSVPEGFSWSLESMVADLLTVTDAATEGPIHLVGESVGGTVALAFALTYPERVRTLTISNGAHVGTGIQNVEDWSEHMGRGGMSTWSAHMMKHRFYPGAISKPAWEWYEAQQASADPGAILDALRVLLGVDLSPRLGAAEMPVLLLHPDASPFIPLATIDALRMGLRDARLQVFAHARHGLPFSHADACARALASFLAEHG